MKTSGILKQTLEQSFIELKIRELPKIHQIHLEGLRLILNKSWRQSAQENIGTKDEWNKQFRISRNEELSSLFNIATCSRVGWAQQVARLEKQGMFTAFCGEICLCGRTEKVGE
jgi:hypothetical protein